jgi:hypothetical protein
MALHAFSREGLVAAMEYGASWVTLPNSLAVLFTIRPISPIHENEKLLGGPESERAAPTGDLD